MSNQFGMHAGQYRNEHTKEQNQQFTVQFSELTARFVAAMSEGQSSSDESVQTLVKRHYDFCSQFWTPTRAAYKSLAMSYILPSPYRDTYEALAPGLGKFHYDAIVVWADENLPE
jgi:hypothetical protein